MVPLRFCELKFQRTGLNLSNPSNVPAPQKVQGPQNVPPRQNVPGPPDLADGYGKHVSSPLVPGTMDGTDHEGGNSVEAPHTTEPQGGPGVPEPSLPHISRVATALGWRVVQQYLTCAVEVESLRHALEVAQRAVGALESPDRLRIDLRSRSVLMTIGSPASTGPAQRDIEDARRICLAVAEYGLRTGPTHGPCLRGSLTGAVPGDGTDDGPRDVQAIQIAIDVLDVAAVRPFWKALTGYVDDPSDSGDLIGLVDPAQCGPPVWFQRMDRPRTGRNRIHLDVMVGQDAAPGRLAVAVAAGGRLVTDEYAPAFWVLSDPEGNEACLCTWQEPGRPVEPDADRD